MNRDLTGVDEQGYDSLCKIESTGSLTLGESTISLTLGEKWQESYVSGASSISRACRMNRDLIGAYEQGYDLLCKIKSTVSLTLGENGKNLTRREVPPSPGTSNVATLPRAGATAVTAA
jgi:hypothetical protein